MFRSLAAFSLVGLSAIAPAAADRASYHGTVNGDIAFTDNVFSERRGSQDGDLFFQVRPGLLFTYGMPRMIHDLNVEAEVTQYALHSEEASVTGRAGWRAFFMTGPRSEIIVGANAGQSVLSAITARSDQPVIEVQPLGRLFALTADASEYGSYIATRHIRLSQGLFARASETDDHEMDPTIVKSAEAGARIGLERSMRNNSVSMELGGSILRLERIAPVGDPMGSRLDRQYNPRARVAWRHDLDRKISTSLDGGLVYVIPYGTDPYNPGDQDRQSGLYPIVGASANYADVWGVAQMSVRRDVSPNLFVGQNTVNDSAVISASLPIPWREDNRRRAPKMVGIGSLAVTRTQLVDPFTSELESSIGMARLDVGFLYAVRPGFTYGVRYELILQTGDRDADMPINGFFRNSFYFTFKIRYPEDIAAQVPKRRAGSVRSDRQDLMPMGAEPVIPDLLDEGGGEGNR